MKNATLTKFHTCCLLVLIMLATACGEVKAEPIGPEICVPYTKDGVLMVAAQRVESAQESQGVENSVRRFLKAAQDGDPKSIPPLYSKADKSFEHVGNALEADPDFFSSYSKIQSAQPAEIFAWGNYRPALIDYSMGTQQAKLLDAFFCTEDICDLSNIFERPERSEDLFSRWVYRYRKEKNPSECPNDSRLAFEVWPEIMLEQQYPLAVYLPEVGSGVTPKASNVWREEMTAACTAKKQDELASGQKSLIPIVELNANDKNSQRRLVTIDVLLGHLQNSKEITPLYTFVDDAIQIDVVKLELADAREVLFVFPHKQDGDKHVFDWSYFGKASGELLSSSQFGAYIQRQLSGTK
ncbi:MAG: hypothetical protein QGI45_04770 [Myxococcota bacterium]|jgi:hypothetical protein|nr:hypothetical protein [Myxococcota bacterium]